MMIAGEVNGILLKSKAKWNADEISAGCGTGSVSDLSLD
jgi:hypothetical protein